MSMHLQMLQVARLASGALGDSAGLVRDFLLKSQTTEGGFRDRSGRSDLYYTVFALDSLLALRSKDDQEVQHAFERALEYLHVVEVEKLDFVHLCCLARCYATIRQWTGKEALALNRRTKTLKMLAAHRSAEGGFSLQPQSNQATVYAGFLGYGAYQDLQEPCPDILKLIQSFKHFETPDGAWANERGPKTGATNATAAAVTMLSFLVMPINSTVSDWLLARAHPQGGFCANPQIQYPDLLSTATALHALSATQTELGPVRERCMDFLDSLWTNEGSFHGHWGEELLDSEYTFYGLLALGHLTVGPKG